MNKFLTPDEIAAQIYDGATIAISGNGGGMIEADYLMAAIEKDSQILVLLKFNFSAFFRYWRQRLQGQ